MVNLLSLDGITQESHDFNRVERQEIQNPEHQGIDTTKQISEYCTKLIREGVYSGGYGHE